MNAPRGRRRIAEARRPVARCRLRNPRKDPNYLGPCPYGTLLPST
ncbi:hypothetical protein COLINT_02182 [Collinsella intestinalis DSM 13280]|uniref:Uncharacterized protein n=1 Tax=Collinsella intestinalis DSM 13280 TaxID=521003 RepID=C4F816_9ACTN|nr:hypothetical protein COLINT_02182 [Collinsella intestinalis DSM 13280]